MVGKGAREKRYIQSGFFFTGSFLVSCDYVALLTPGTVPAAAQPLHTSSSLDLQQTSYMLSTYTSFPASEWTTGRRVSWENSPNTFFFTKRAVLHNEDTWAERRKRQKGKRELKRRTQALSCYLSCLLDASQDKHKEKCHLSRFCSTADRILQLGRQQTPRCFTSQFLGLSSIHRKSAQ